MMKKEVMLTHEFVEYIPDHLKEKIVYVSIPFATASHLCACGCGKEVVTPISPTDWKVTFDGQAISLDPSIGNWGFNCKSHYWIHGNRIVWAEKWSPERVELGRNYDRQAKVDYYTSKNSAEIETKAAKAPLNKNKKSTWEKLKDFFL